MVRPWKGLRVLLPAVCHRSQYSYWSAGKSNPYCELTMGAQCYTSRPIGDTLNPKWNFNCQFFVKDLYQDVLCITVFEKDQFSPDGQWMNGGRTHNSDTNRVTLTVVNFVLLTLREKTCQATYDNCQSRKAHNNMFTGNLRTYHCFMLSSASICFSTLFQV